MLLAGDIGGTKTILTLYSEGRDIHFPDVEETFPSSGYSSLDEMIRKFLGRHDFDLSAASFGIAGPVMDGRVVATNLPWVVDREQLSVSLDIPSVSLINDLEAVAYSLDLLEAADLHRLSSGSPQEGGPRAIIAPGTGLGETYMTWDGSRYRPQATEGGHTGFSPNSPVEVRLLAYLQDRFEHVSFERVCSGKGIPNLYRFLRDTGEAGESHCTADELAVSSDPTPVIFDHALGAEKDCSLCTATIDLFTSILGSEAGNLALKINATGGLFLGGGIPPRILPILESGRFMEAFLHKGRLRHLMERMPVSVILNPRAGLLGAARYGMERLTGGP